MNQDPSDSVGSGRGDLAEAKAERDRLRDQVDRQQQDLTSAQHRAESAEESLEKVQATLEDSEENLRTALHVRSSLLQQLEEVGEEVAELEDRQELLEHRAAIATWKLASMRRRRWWQLGSLLSDLRRDPSALPAVVRRLVGVLRDPTPTLPRPKAPPSLASERGSSDQVVEHSDPIQPRRDVVAVGIVSDQVAELLDHEVLFWRLHRNGWREVLTASDPQVAIFDHAETQRWDEEVVEAVRRWAHDVRAELIEIDPGTTGATIHRRLHNPIGAHARPAESATVDATGRLVDGRRYDDERSFLDAVKRHRVAVVPGRPAPADLARVAGTATALVVSDADSGYGIHAATEEARAAATQALVRSEVLAARTAHTDMRRAHRAHDIGALLSTDEQVPRVDVMVATNREHRLEDLLDNLSRQTYPNARLFLITHGLTFDEGRVRDLAEQRDVQLAGVWHEDEDVVLGEVFNRGFGRTEAQLVAKMDDDDFYGTEYLWDLVTAKDASAAEVAGKWAHYAYLEGPDTTIYRFGSHEHRFHDVVAISTLLMDRSVFEDDQFPPMPYGSGSVFLRSIGAAGARVFAADRWNYLYIRGTDGQRNTFPVTDMKMLSNSDVVCTGLSLDEVTV